MEGCFAWWEQDGGGALPGGNVDGYHLAGRGTWGARPGACSRELADLTGLECAEQRRVHQKVSASQQTDCVLLSSGGRKGVKSSGSPRTPADTRSSAAEQQGPEPSTGIDPGDACEYARIAVLHSPDRTASEP